MSNVVIFCQTNQIWS